MSLLRRHPGHPLISKYAVRALRSYPPDEMLAYAPQLVQLVRHDQGGFVYNFIVEAAQRSQLLAHQMIWNMKTNMYMDEDAQHLDPVLGKKLAALMADIQVR